MKKSLAYILTLLLCVVACDDNTGSLGGSIVPDQDSLSINTATYWASSRSIPVDSVLCRTDKVYLGRFTDPHTQSMFEADFIAQFNCEEGGNVFPEDILGDSAVKVELRLFFSSYFGDPTGTMTAEVYELDQTLQEGVRYYTNLDPTQFYDTLKAPVATKVYTLTDYTLEDSELADPEHYANINIPLPTEIGTRMIEQYRANKDLFANASSFIEHVCKGYYVKATRGDGTLVYIDQATLNIHYLDSKRDSVFVTQFAGTEEVLQANRFANADLHPLIADSTCTYLKTPAGIFTEVTLPIDSIMAHGDSINTAKIIFQCYYDAPDTPYPLGTPQALLMIHKDHMHTFFEKNRLTDNVSSFYTAYNSKLNRYEYPNISRLITYCDGLRQQSPEWNKVVLIPVTPTIDSNNSIVNFRHDFSLSTVRLVGGKDKVKVKVISSQFD